MIPSCLGLYPWAQIMLAVFFQMFYIMYYSGNRPHTSRRRVRLETFNETMLIACMYCHFLFSDFNLDADFQFLIGYAYICVIGLLCVVNIGSLLLKMLDSYRSQ